jgi:hypothetical protein
MIAGRLATRSLDAWPPPSLVFDLDGSGRLKAALLEESDWRARHLLSMPKVWDKEGWRHALIQSVSGMLGFDISRERHLYGWATLMTGRSSGRGHDHRWSVPSRAVTWN